MAGSWRVPLGDEEDDDDDDDDFRPVKVSQIDIMKEGKDDVNRSSAKGCVETKVKEMVTRISTRDIPRRAVFGVAGFIVVRFLS